jgi:hypothetical protein
MLRFLQADRKGVPLEVHIATYKAKSIVKMPSSTPYTCSISVVCALSCMLIYVEALVSRGPPAHIAPTTRTCLQVLLDLVD